VSYRVEFKILLLVFKFVEKKVNKMLAILRQHYTVISKIKIEVAR